MNDELDEGQEVSLIQSGISFVNPLRSIDMEGLRNWVKSIEPNMQQYLEEYRAAESMNGIYNAFLDRYITEMDKSESTIPGYVIVEASALTKLGLGALLFDSKVEISPDVIHMIELIGIAPILHLFHISDYYEHQNKTPNSAYLGRIKVVTFNELFYNPIT